MQPRASTAVAPAPRAAATLTALGATLMVVLLHPFAFLVSHFHVSTSVANYIVGLVIGGAGWTLSVFFPWVLPYILTIRGLVAAFGVGFAAGW